MKDTAKLIHIEDAMRFINQISDPVTRTLVHMSFVHLVTQIHVEKRIPLASDLDMKFLVTTLKDFFAEHDVLARTLQGEKVGAWFDDDSPDNGNGMLTAAKVLNCEVEH